MKLSAGIKKLDPGHLRRMYLDRMSHVVIDINSKVLSCGQGNILGNAMIYKRDNRPAFRLYVDAVAKKAIKIKDTFSFIPKHFDT